MCYHIKHGRCGDMLLVQVLLSPERLHRVEHMPVIVDLLSYILKREPLRRPTASAIVAR